MDAKLMDTHDTIAAAIEEMCVLNERWAKEEGRVFDVEAYAAETYRKAASGNFIAILVYEGDQAIGCAEVTFAYDPAISGWSAFADKGYVVPECRGSGAFSAIMDLALEKAQKAGCTYGWLTVDEDNHAARKIYEERGGKVASVIYRTEFE